MVRLPLRLHKKEGQKGAGDLEPGSPIHKRGRVLERRRLCTSDTSPAVYLNIGVIPWLSNLLVHSIGDSCMDDSPGAHVLPLPRHS